MKKTNNIFRIIAFTAIIGFSFSACDNGSVSSTQPTIDEIDFGVGATFTTHNFNNADGLLAFWNDPNLTSGNYVVIADQPK